MSSIVITSNVNKLISQLNDLAWKQVPFANALALTRLGQKAVDSERRTMMTTYDNPTPYTLNSLMASRATKQRQYIEFGFRQFAGKGTPANDFMYPTVFGVERSAKRFEKRLRASGQIGARQFLTPGSSVKKDSYGNVSKGQYSKILSSLGSQLDPAQNSKAKKQVYFAGRPGGTKAFGIYLRKKENKVASIFRVTDKTPKYRSMYPFFKNADRFVAQHFDKEFGWALAQAIRTAKR